jgi:hypothetical protein
VHPAGPAAATSSTISRWIGRIRIEVKGSPLAEMVSDDVMQALGAESEDALAEFVVPSGEIVMPMDAHIVTAARARSRWGWMKEAYG